MKSFYNRYLAIPTYQKLLLFIFLLGVNYILPESIRYLATTLLLFFIIERIFTALKVNSNKRKMLDEYGEKVKAYLLDGNLSEKEKQELENFKLNNNLSTEETKKYHIQGFESFFKRITNDSRITEKEREEMVKIYTDLKLPTDNLIYSQDEFNKCYTLDQIEKGVIPLVGNQDLNINLKANEKLHYAGKAWIIKNKTIVDKINYGGLNFSIRIMKGVSYRTGSVRMTSEKRDILVTDDVGYIYLTTESLGYMGMSKHFSIPYIKIVSLDFRNNYLYIYKQGKEAPYIIAMNDYEVLLAITSFKINS